MKEEMKELFIECCNQIQIKEIDEDKVEIANFDEILSKEFIDGLLKIANGAENLEKEIQNETFKIEILNAIQDDEELKIKVDCYLKMVSAKLLEKLSVEQPELPEQAEGEKSKLGENTDAQEQQQILEPVNQNTATMLKMGEQEEKKENSEKEENTNAQVQQLQEQNEPVDTEKPAEQGQQSLQQQDKEAKEEEKRSEQGEASNQGNDVNAQVQPLLGRNEPAMQEQQPVQEQENLVQGVNIKVMINNLTDALGKFDVATEKMEALHSVRAIESNILVNKLGNAIKTINTLNNNLATLSNLINTTTDVLVARTQTMDDFGKSVADDINDKQEITGIGVKIIEEESLQEIGEEAIKNIKKLSKGNGALTLATSLNEVKKDFDSINAMYGNKFSHLKALM